MSNNYNANIYLNKNDLNDIEDRIKDITDQIRENIYDNTNSFLRNIQVGDVLSGKTLYLSLPRTVHESIADTDTLTHTIITIDDNKYIVYKYVNGYKHIGIRVPDPDDSSNNKIFYFYGYSTTNQNGNPYLNQVRFKLPKDFGTVTYVSSNNICQYIKICDETIIPNYTKHIWVDNELPTMQKIDNIEHSINNIGLYYEKPNGWVQEKEWLPNATKRYAGNYGVGIKTISYQDLNRWYNNLDLIDFSDLNNITIWNAINDISQIEWNGESDEEWVDNFNLVLYDFTTEDNNTLITENGDTMLVLVNERV